jgi:hypothetical protein
MKNIFRKNSVGVLFFLVFCAMFFGVARAQGEPAALDLKLPYAKGVRLVVVQGYNSPPTHIHKDAYALDFSGNGCDAYGNTAVAAVSGTVILAKEDGYNGGYGTQVLIKSAGIAASPATVTRYAHLITGSIPANIAVGAPVARGESLGAIGNTGWVAGAACRTHPGTHIHFAAYTPQADGSFVAKLPEPISGYSNLYEGGWYLSDNGPDTQSTDNLNVNIPQDINIATPNSTSTDDGLVLGAMTSTLPEIPNDQDNQNKVVDIPSFGGVTVEPRSTPQPDQNVASSSPTITITDDLFDSSTLAIDLAWTSSTAVDDGSTTYGIFLEQDGGADLASSTLVATTTATKFSYKILENEFGKILKFIIAVLQSDLTTIATSSPSQAVSLPNWSTAIQSVDSVNSNPSWYDDNWYQLGTGFYGTIKSLTFEGFINGSDYFASHLSLSEYLDPQYIHLNQGFPISDNAPFTNGLKKVTIDNLNIPLQPNKYYRLETWQDYQNRSVVLAGTNTTGTAMWDEYISGTGGVQHTYAFYPYISAVMIPGYPPLQPPNPPPSMSLSFDSLSSILDIAWPAATDPDTKSNLLTYQVALTTSSAPVAGDWHPSLLPFGDGLSVAYGNIYTVSVRAVDDLGNVSKPLTESWSFPSWYVPVPEQLDHSAGLPMSGSQSFVLAATTTVMNIRLWTAPQYGDFSCCAQSFLSLRDASGSPVAVSSPVTIGRGDPAGAESYIFSSPLVLSPGKYSFQVSQGPGGPTNGTYVLGSASDTYSDGSWSLSSGQDAFFQLQELDQGSGP